MYKYALIKGITIGNKEIKTIMYPDDTAVFVSDTDSNLASTKYAREI